VKSGTLVRIKNNLDISFRNYGRSDTMEKMKGHIFPIKETFSSDGVTITRGNDDYSFSKYDLIDISTENLKVKRIKPVTFDPKNLVL
jgi:hypothetical protein